MWIITPYNKVDTSFYTVKVIPRPRKSWIAHVASLAHREKPARSTSALAATPRHVRQGAELNIVIVRRMRRVLPT